MSHLPSNVKGDTQDNTSSQPHDSPKNPSYFKDSPVVESPEETNTYSVSRMGEGGSNTRIKTKIDGDTIDGDTMNAWNNNSEDFRAPDGQKDDRIIDEEQQDRFQEQQQAVEEQSGEIDTQINTALSSQRIMKGTLATAAVGGTAIGIGGLAYFVSGSDSTAFIHAIRHLIA